MYNNSHPGHRATLAQLCEKAERFYSLGRVAEAEEILISALEIDPSCDRIHSNLGVINWERHHREVALDHFAKAYSINPYCSKTASKFIYSLLETNKHSLANVMFNKARGILSDTVELEKYFSKTIAQKDFAGHKIDTIDVYHLHRALNFKEELHYPLSSFIKDLSKWRMEIDDAPIFRYLYRNFYTAPLRIEATNKTCEKHVQGVASDERELAGECAALDVETACGPGHEHPQR